MACFNCYESVPRCMGSVNGGTVCTSRIGLVSSYRDCNGVYAPAFRAALPVEFAGVDDSHFDHATSFTAPAGAVAAVTAEDTAMRVKLVADGLLRTELGDVSNYVEDHPEDREMVGRNVRRMLDLYTLNQHYAAQAIMVQVEQARQRLLQPAGASVPATTSAEYKQRNEPPWRRSCSR